MRGSQRGYHSVDRSKCLSLSISLGERARTNRLSSVGKEEDEDESSNSHNKRINAMVWNKGRIESIGSPCKMGQPDQAWRDTTTSYVRGRVGRPDYLSL